MDKPKVLFLLKKRNYYGFVSKVSYGLLTSCQLIKEALKKSKIECVIKETVDDNTIDKDVFENSPTHVFLEAIWTHPKKIEELLSIPRYKKIKWFIRVHSKAEFLSHEGMAFKWLLDYYEIAKNNKNFKISFNNDETVDDFRKALDIKSEYTPNIYLFDKVKHKPNYSNNLKIGSFSALRPFKNLVNQAIAALQFAKKNNLTIEFNIKDSLNHESSQGENVLKNLKALFNETRHELVITPWTSHEDFLKLVKSMDLMMNVSYSESFCIAAADGVTQNIPTIGSQEIKFLDSWYQVDPTDINGIAEKLEFAYYGSFIGLHKLNEWKLNRHNNKAVEAWLKVLD